MSYSAMINGLKLLLPLLALGLLSTLFLFSRSAPEEADLPFITDLRARTDGAADGMRAAFYTGSTDAGDGVMVAASGVRSDPTDPGRALAADLQARIDYQDGSDLVIRSADGQYGVEAQILHLMGEVTLISSTGYEIRTETLIADTAEATAESPGAIVADGPPGRITAGGLQILRPDPASKDVQLVFTKGVKLIYHPNRNSE